MRSCAWILLIILCICKRAAGQACPPDAGIIEGVYARTMACEPQIRAAIIKWGKTNGAASLTPASREWLIDSIKLVPVVKLSLETRGPGGYGCKVIADSLFEICAIVYPSRRVYIYTPRDGKLALKGESGKQMSLLAEKSIPETASPLFVYLFDFERYKPDMIGWFGRHLRWQFFIYPAHEAPLDSENMLTRRYGGAANYFEYRKREQVKLQIKKEALSTLSYDSIKYYWQFHTKYYQQDTTGSIRLLLNEIKAVTGLSDHKLHRIGDLVMAALKAPPALNINFNDSLYTSIKYFAESPYIFFKSIDLAPILAKVLDKEQLQRYKRKTAVSDYQVITIKNRLWIQFHGDYKAVDSFIKSNFIKTI